MNQIRLQLSRINYWLVVIFILAVALRAIQPGHFPATVDELLTIHSGMQLARHGQWTWIGNPTSYAPIPAHSPFTVYLTALSLLISPNWILPRLLVAFMGSMAVPGMYLMLRRYGSEYAALTGAALLAVMPLAVDWSRYAWNPNFAQVFLVFWLYTGLLGYVERKYSAQIMHWLCLSAAIQCSLSLIALLPLSGSLVIYSLWQTQSDRSVQLKTMLFTLLIAILTIMPLVIGNIGVQQGNFTFEVYVAPLRDDVLRLHMADWHHVMTYFGLLTGSATFRPSLHLDSHAAWWWPDSRLHPVLWLQVIVVAGGIIAGLVNGFKQRQLTPQLWFSMVTLWSFIWLFTDSGRPIPSYFLMTTLYAAIAVFALALARFSTGRTLLRVVALFFITGQLWLTLAHLDWQHRNENILSLSEVEAMVSSWVDESVIVVIQPTPETPVEQEWMLRWQILAEWYPITIVETFPDFSSSPEAIVLVSARPLLSAYGTGAVYSLPHQDFYFVLVKPDG